MSTTNSKWLPPQQEGFGPWIEFEGPYDRSPVAADTEVGYLLRVERKAQCYHHEGHPAGAYRWGSLCVAYCVKLEEQPAASDPSAQAPAQTADTTLVGGKLTGDHYYRVVVNDPMSLDLQPYVAECADIIEALGMTFNEGEAFKALWRLAAARQGRGKPGNKPQYDADKAAHYGQRVAACERRKAGAA